MWVKEVLDLVEQEGTESEIKRLISVHEGEVLCLIKVSVPSGVLV